jgi:hypothetical protein
MRGGPHGCCNPDGRCKTKTPGKKGSGAVCNQIAFDHQKTIDLHFDLPGMAVRSIEIPLPRIYYVSGRGEEWRIDPSPPDLQILHSVFLI